MVCECVCVRNMKLLSNVVQDETQQQQQQQHQCVAGGPRLSVPQNLYSSWSSSSVTRLAEDLAVNSRSLDTYCGSLAIMTQYLWSNSRPCVVFLV